MSSRFRRPRIATVACPPRPRRRVLVAGLAGAGLLLAACGSTGSSVAKLATGTTTSRASQSTPPGAAAGGGSFSSGSGGQASATLVSQGPPGSALKFATCMRSHGVPTFPDPSGSGATVINSSSGINPQSPQFQAAQGACGKLLGHGGAPSPAQQAQGLAAALKFSACMRSHGITGFPDPTSSGGGIQLKLSQSSGIDPGSPLFQTAQRTCQKLLPGGGPSPAGAAAP